MQPSEPCGPNWPKQGRSLSSLPTPLISAGSPEDLNFSSRFWDGGSLEKKGSSCPWGLASARGSLSHSGPAAGAWPHRFQALSQRPAVITPFLQGSHDLVWTAASGTFSDMNSLLVKTKVLASLSKLCLRHEVCLPRWATTNPDGRTLSQLG